VIGEDQDIIKKPEVTFYLEYFIIRFPGKDFAEEHGNQETDWNSDQDPLQINYRVSAESPMEKQPEKIGKTEIEKKFSYHIKFSVIARR
jgi:hypothetical protein